MLIDDARASGGSRVAVGQVRGRFRETHHLRRIDGCADGAALKEQEREREARGGMWG